MHFQVMPRLTSFLCLCLLGCHQRSPVGSHDAAPPDMAPQLTCGAPKASACSNPASVVRGMVRLGPGVVPTSTAGQLVVALTHYREGEGSFGGYPHAGITIPTIDLAKGPVPFQVDMCSNGEMWSEDNCEYNLIVILDTNKNNGFDQLLPDPGEAATRIGNVLLSCTGESQCMDVVLDCTAGASCTQYFDPMPVGYCKCAMPGCKSQIIECTP
jgi:hypothetical protein